jgi:cell wall-associated NlpC family hydrolase
VNTPDLAQGRWINSLVGQPWSQERNCWWLVRHVFATQYGIEMPFVAVDDYSDTNVSAIKRASQVSGWRPATGRPRDRDLVLLRRSHSAGRHIGVMVRAGYDLRLLHNEGSVDTPRPGVVWEPLDQVLGRYVNPEYWRQTGA